MSLDRLIQNLENLDLNKVTRVALQGEEQRIIDLVTIDQLFKKGIDGDGNSLDDVRGFGYAPFTIKQKVKKNLPTDHITLFDTGKYYKSHRVNIGNDFFEVISDPIKDDTNLFVEFGDAIVDLNDQSLDKLINAILPKTQEAVRKSIL